MSGETKNKVCQDVLASVSEQNPKSVMVVFLDGKGKARLQVGATTHAEIAYMGKFVDEVVGDFVMGRIKLENKSESN